MSVIEVKVPDIGDFDAVEVIEVLVKAGDTVEEEQSLIVLESDKASMEVPSSAAGKVVDVKVKVGDKVAKGTLICTVEGGAAAAPAPAPAAAPKPAAAPAPAPAAAPAAATHAGGADIQCEMLVLGAGPGGYSAAFRSADLGMNTVLVERYGTLGGVCLNVGCIPSKALLHNAAVIDEAKALAAHGILFGEAKIDLDGLRHYKESVVGKLTGGLSGMAKARKVQVVRGIGTFLDPHHLEVQETEGDSKATNGKKTVIRFEKAIIAAGSQ
ncbi:MAG TPA: dihydrolipoyl dehydrogenase, partial [Cupriavidus sp.]|nr:dihydrolipoyl dehydrogenase [Cupriavidus sp.]